MSVRTPVKVYKHKSDHFALVASPVVLTTKQINENAKQLIATAKQIGVLEKNDTLIMVTLTPITNDVHISIFDDAVKKFEELDITTRLVNIIIKANSIPFMFVMDSTGVEFYDRPNIDVTPTEVLCKLISTMCIVYPNYTYSCNV
jgi:hypothetical protein